MTTLGTENRFQTISKEEALGIYLDVTDFNKPANTPESLQPAELNSLGLALKSAVADLPGMLPERRASRAELLLLKSLGTRALHSNDDITFASVMTHSYEHLPKSRYVYLRIIFGHEIHQRQVG